MNGPVRVYLVGAHATGKTTLARWIRDQFGLPMISEVARGVLAEMEAKLEALRTDLDLVSDYQAQVFGGVPCRQTGMATIAKPAVDSAAVVTALGVLEAEYGELLRTYQVRSGRCPCFASRAG